MSDVVGASAQEIITGISRIELRLKALLNDITASGVPKEFKNSFALFIDEWINFRDNVGYFEKITPEMFTGVYARMQQYEKDTEEWRKKFTAFGGRSSSPSLTVTADMPRPGLLSAITGSFGSMPWWVWVGGGAALWYLFQGGPKPRSSGGGHSYRPH